jgi:hypothetical protein
MPSPSSIDQESWRQIANTRGAPMAFIIVGYKGLWAGIAKPGLFRAITYGEAEISPAGVAFKPKQLW